MDYTSAGRIGSGTSLTSNAMNTIQSGADAAAESPSQIRDGVGGCEQLLSDLHNALNGLERRLDTVLTPTPPTVSPTKDTGRNVPTPNGSHLLGRIAILQEGYAHAIVRVRELTGRIEI